MKQNMGVVDRSLRTFIVVPGLVLSSWLVFGFGSVIGIVFLVVAGIMLATSAVGFCPAYIPFGISTARSTATGRLFEHGEATRSEAGEHTGSTRGRAA